MTTVAPARPEVTAPTPPPMLQLASRNASPSRPSSNHSSPAGSPRLDRFQLAKERREDKAKTEGLSELLRDKERRVQQQLERCAEERERKMEEQRRKEQQRRTAAEGKRRQQQEEEKVILRPRLAPPLAQLSPMSFPLLPEPPSPVTHGALAQYNIFCSFITGIFSAHHQVNDFLTPPTSDQPINKRLSNSSAALHSPERGERASGVSHRLVSSGTQRPYRSSSNRRSITGLPEENMADKTTDSQTIAARSSSFRAQSKGPSTPKRVRSTKSRAQSPCSPGQFPPSPLRQRATTPGAEDRGHPEVKGHGTLERKSSKTETTEKKIPKSTSRELAAESPGTPTGRSVGGTTDAEEASRLLAERRRLARVQKEQEERQRQEEERLRVEEEERREREAQEQREQAALQAEEERARREEERRRTEDEERRQKEQRWKDMQDQLDREREEAFLRAQREAERKRRERELQHIQEEQERQQRKKRIEEIMKRTRKTEGELPSPAPVSEAQGSPGLAAEEEASTPAEAPVIMLGPLESKSCLDELSDGVQSMDVSPVSRDDQASAQDFSPVTEGIGDVNNALEQRSAQGSGGDPEVTPPCPKLQAGSGAALGDLNKNLLIQAYSAASESSQLIHSLGPGKLDVQ